MEIEQFIEEHYDYIRGVVFSMPLDESETEETINDVLFIAWRKLDTFKGDSHIRTWLYRVTKNRCYWTIRQRGVRSFKDPHLWVDVKTEAAIDEESTREMRYVIQYTWSRLDAEDRELLLRGPINGETYASIADSKRISNSAARKRVFSARRRFIQEYSREANIVDAATC